MAHACPCAGVSGRVFPTPLRLSHSQTKSLSQVVSDSHIKSRCTPSKWVQSRWLMRVAEARVTCLPVAAPGSIMSCSGGMHVMHALRRQMWVGREASRKVAQVANGFQARHRCLANASTTILAEGDGQVATGEEESQGTALPGEFYLSGLPEIKEPKRVVLVRHGESTWNATGRIQGSSDFSELTEKGLSQAETSRQMLLGDHFDVCFSSPLRRSSKTAEVIWGSRTGPVIPVHDLREIDLYTFQGLLKEEGKARYGAQYLKWQKDAANFEIDGHYPVRELWERARRCWDQILAVEGRNVLVVAHNAVNQALVATAAGLGPEYFRLLLQSNCGVSVLDFTPQRRQQQQQSRGNDSSSSGSSPGSDESSEVDTSNSLRPDAEGSASSVASLPPLVRLNRLNQTPSPPVAAGLSGGRQAKSRVILVSHGSSDSSFHGRFEASDDEKLNMLGVVQSRKAAELLLDVRVSAILTSSMKRAKTTADAICEVQEAADCLVDDCIPRYVDVISLSELRDFDFGAWKGKLKSEVVAEEKWEEALKHSPPSGSSESLGSLWQRAQASWDRIRSELAKKEESHDGAINEVEGAAEGGQEQQKGNEGKLVIVVVHEAVHEALVANVLHLGTDAFGRFRFDAGGISVIDFPDGPGGRAVVRCLNYTAHLGRWAVPVTAPSLNDEDF